MDAIQKYMNRRSLFQVAKDVVIQHRLPVKTLPKHLQQDILDDMGFTASRIRNKGKLSGK